MKFDEYQKKADGTALYKRIPGYEYIYPVLGLAGETGEVVEKFKKMIRADEALTDDKKIEIKKELGDVLWYLSQIGTELGISLEEIALANLEKIEDRKKRGVLHSSGDNR